MNFDKESKSGFFFFFGEGEGGEWGEVGHLLKPNKTVLQDWRVGGGGGGGDECVSSIGK